MYAIFLEVAVVYLKQLSHDSLEEPGLGNKDLLRQF
jgi:hypothetical protein